MQKGVKYLEVVAHGRTAENRKQDRIRAARVLLAYKLKMERKMKHDNVRKA